MVFDKKTKESIKINLKEKITIKPERSGLMKGSVSFIVGLICFIVITIKFIFTLKSINEVNISDSGVIAYHAQFTKAFSMMIYVVVAIAIISVMVMGFLMVKEAFDNAIKKRSYDFDSKNLIYYISLSKHFKNKELDNFILSELRNLEKDKIIIMKDKIEDKDFKKNIVNFEKKLKLKESDNLEKLEKNKNEINQKIKESKKILGKKTNNVSISND